jgi:hypothetical protein
MSVPISTTAAAATSAMTPVIAEVNGTRNLMQMKNTV